MFKFITRQHFLINVLVAIGLFLAIIFIFLSMLDVITRHNKYEKVPEVTKMKFDDAVKALEDKGFVVEVQDSVWEPEIAPYTIIRQSPLAGQMVKSHRIIFLTVNKSQPPIVEMPNLVGYSFRNALLYINQLGLKLGDTSRKPDIARDAVLEQLYNGRPIPAGTRIFEGSVISFVLGSGLGEEEGEVPDLFGLTYAEARIMLQTLGLNVGALLPDPNVRDTANAFVYRQSPDPVTLLPEGQKRINRIRVGQSIDLWLSKEAREKLTPEETPSDLEENED